VKDMVPVIGKLLAMNDDIAAVLLPAIVTALEKVRSFCARWHVQLREPKFLVRNVKLHARVCVR